jgi:hypothetical protein
MFGTCCLQQVSKYNGRVNMGNKTSRDSKNQVNEHPKHDIVLGVATVFPPRSPLETPSKTAQIAQTIQSPTSTSDLRTAGSSEPGTWNAGGPLGASGGGFGMI